MVLVKEKGEVGEVGGVVRQEWKDSEAGTQKEGKRLSLYSFLLTLSTENATTIRGSSAGVCMGEVMHSNFNQCFNVRQHETCVSFKALHIYTYGVFLAHLLTAARPVVLFYF